MLQSSHRKAGILTIAAMLFVMLALLGLIYVTFDI